MKFCLLFNLSPCARYCLLIGSQLTTWSQGNLHYIGLHFFQLDREFFCLLPSLARLYSAAASPSEHLHSDGSLAIIVTRHLKLLICNVLCCMVACIFNCGLMIISFQAESHSFLKQVSWQSFCVQYLKCSKFLSIHPHLLLSFGDTDGLYFVS